MKRPPWIWIVLGWGALLTATFFTVRLCVRNAPQEVPLDSPQASRSHGG
jgi:hypothetical protein